jgi:hypothetical protein
LFLFFLFIIIINFSIHLNNLSEQSKVVYYEVGLGREEGWKGGGGSNGVGEDQFEIMMMLTSFKQGC